MCSLFYNLCEEVKLLVKFKSGELTNQLKILRAKFDISQNELANQVGVSRQTINSIEKNKYSPSLVLAFKLSILFNVKIEEIFNYKE
ncbi:helix-turn-helix transcriptional regulator [Staphylococcus epidermidis]|nr:helix-turn-helix transcriptional regulator [Staphylococcus epidermidis]MBF2290184.1 helix-turn-helix transcriptional regulator [Staphylococcus epidermidis]MBF2292476.1 helix-turn-helix transcriptional regulator [Staphylococcus epidermidis]MBF2294790.1 helix-turn-helix transcriptional regulator [Staphylococcus epidermidis]MBF2299364.1 helix-turn-helix transcriptional regulator [Staphylococcus epidermidis]